jgi:hypothetical protein
MNVREYNRDSWDRQVAKGVYGHTLEDQLGGQLDAGFVLTGFYEDRDPAHPLAKFLPAFIATRAVKPR